MAHARELQAPLEDASREVRPIPLLVTAVAAVLVALLPIHLEPRAHGTLVVLTVAAGLWMTEAVPVACTALLIPVLAVLLHVADSKAAFAGFGDPILFLFLGTFLLTTAAFEHGLQGRLTHAVLQSRSVAQHPSRLLWAVAFLGCGISAWVNNTATTALILPLALTAEGRVPRRLLVGVLLMASYAPSLGGLATPVGTAPNLIGLRLLEKGAGEHVSFAHWCALFAPLALLSTLLSGTYFHLLGRRRGAAALQNESDVVPSGRAPAPPVAARGPWSRAEKTLLPLYVVVIALWILPGILQATRLREQAWIGEWSTRLPETSVPLLGGLLLFLLPSGRGTARILDIGVLKRIDWSTLLLFGGGLSLGSLMFDTGLARALGDVIFAAVPWRGEIGIVLAATLMGVLVSEVTSNTASASLVVPVVLALAQTAGVDPLKPALAATVACSFGFMLPVSTPPNALVFATGRLRIVEMVRHGIWLDLAGIVLITGWVMLFA
jgi:sodium-dependent dicarboxylate transporter 2/3/5